MKKAILLCAMLATGLALSAGSPIELRDVVSGRYSPRYPAAVRSMNDGEHFTRMVDNRCIVRYNYKSGEAVDTLFNTATARECGFKTFDGYQFSPDESLILIQTDTRPIYRRSFTAQHHIYNRHNNKLAPLSPGGAQQAPLFSPDGTMIAFVRDNNIYLVKLLFNNSESAVTTDGERGKIINGLPDWVYEEEFSVTRSFDFSADSKMIAYVRYDESRVPQYDMPMHGRKLSGDPAAFAAPYSYKYPVTGETNSSVTLHSFDIKSRVTRKIELPLEADGYIPRISFTDDADKLLAITLNRHQNRMEIFDANPRSGICKMLLREESDRYLEESAYRDLALYPGHFVLQSERSGYNQLYLYSLGGALVRQLTDGESPVTALLGWERKSNTFYYTAYDGSPLRTALFSVNAKGETKRLSERQGSNSTRFSSNMSYYINTYSNLTTPPQTVIYDQKGKALRTIEDNADLSGRLSQIEMPQKELFSFTTAQGTELNGWMMKPAHFDPTRRYPVVMFQYSGPGSQQVTDSWNCGFYPGGIWEGYLAQQGYIAVCVDGRGTGGRGADFEKGHYMKLGTVEAQDQVQAALYLKTLPYVDGGNIAIWGWSYGGYNTLMSMSEGTPVFKCGVAVAPPTDWRFYDTIYGERYMRTPKENVDGYDRGSAIKQADKLHGNLLLIHGTADDNVHFSNSVEYISALVAAGKPYQLLIYPNSNHSIYHGSNTRYHLFTQISDFFNKNLKD